MTNPNQKSSFEFEGENSKTTFVLSLGLHGAFFLIIIISAFIPSRDVLNVTPMNVVVMDKPKIRPLQPKRQPPKEIPKEDVVKNEAPQLNDQIQPDKKPIKEDVQVKPDSNKLVKEEVFKEMPVLSQTMTQDMSDPRLKFWFKRVAKKIQMQWNPPRGIGILGTAMVTVEFKALRSGKVIDVGIQTSSGNERLDEIGTNTMERVGNLPPIPANYREKEELHIYIKFPYRGN